MHKQQIRLFKWGYTINENETEFEVDNIDTPQRDPCQDINTNVLNVNCVSI